MRQDPNQREEEIAQQQWRIQLCLAIGFFAFFGGMLAVIKESEDIASITQPPFHQAHQSVSHVVRFDLKATQIKP